MLPRGSVIDEKYEIVSTLGVGGFGAVYKAVQKQFDREVALKMLNTTLLQEPDGLARFEREAKAIDALKHKHVVGFYGYGAWQNAPYMVMELIEGTSLDKLISSEAHIDATRALRMARQVLEALGSAHLAGVVHRDLKPSNIMLTQDPDGRECVKIIDFGLAKLMPGYGIPGQKLTETGYALGSCHYMPPEQALGRQIDGRADIYAVGCIFYHMLAGHPPFDADNNIGIMYQHLNNTPASLARFIAPAELVEPIITFANNCMAKEVDARYQTCADAVHDIDRILSSQFTGVIPRAPQQMAAQAPQKGPQWAITLAALSLGALSVFGLYQHSKSEQAEHEKMTLAMWDAVPISVPYYDHEVRDVKNWVDQHPNTVDLRDKLLAMRRIFQFCKYHIRNDMITDKPVMVPYIKRALEIRRTVPKSTSAFPDIDIVEIVGKLPRQEGSDLLKKILAGQYVLSPQATAYAKHFRARELEYDQKFAEAEQIIEEALATMLASNDIYRMREVYHSYINLLIKQGKSSKAHESVKKMLKLDRGNWSKQPMVLLAAARAALADKDYASALTYAKAAEPGFQSEMIAHALPARLIAIAAAAKLGNNSEAKRLCNLDEGRWDPFDEEFVDNFDLRVLKGSIEKDEYQKLEDIVKQHGAFI